MLTKGDLIAFEQEVAEAFKQKRIRGPVHLSGGNEDALIEAFRNVGSDEWVFSTYRNHYHALLHGISREWLMREILAGRSMNIASPEHKFLTSAIVGGTLSIATGVAYAQKLKNANKMVHCFVGDMAATTGAFHEAYQYAMGHGLIIKFYIEDNGMSCDSPTQDCWGHVKGYPPKKEVIEYKRVYPHAGVGSNVF